MEIILSSSSFRPFGAPHWRFGLISLSERFVLSLMMASFTCPHISLGIIFKMTLMLQWKALKYKLKSLNQLQILCPLHLAWNTSQRASHGHKTTCQSIVQLIWTSENGRWDTYSYTVCKTSWIKAESASAYYCSSSNNIDYFYAFYILDIVFFINLEHIKGPKSEHRNCLAVCSDDCCPETADRECRCSTGEDRSGAEGR